MGDPVVAIPESMTSRLEAILRENGVDVERQPLDERDDPEQFLLLLLCTDGHVSVDLTVQRVGDVINREGPVIVFSPRSKGILHALRQSNESGELMDRISKILIRKGAWIPVPENAT